MEVKKQQTLKEGRDRGMFPVFAAVSISFLLAIVVSIYSLAKLARENTKELDTMLTYRIYDFISSSLNEPITVSATMACDDFLADFLKREDELSEEEAVSIMQRYLKGLKDALNYDSAFLVSENSRRYYTYEGLNKIVKPESDPHDIWYTLFIEKDKPYDLDVDTDEVNQGFWTVFVNARILDEDGKLLGVCGVGVQMTSLQELFTTCEEEYSVKVNLVDKNGLVQVDTEDINIENAWLDPDVINDETAGEYYYQTLDNGDFSVTKYVEYLGWYLVVRSKPTAINQEYINIIFLNIVLFLIVMTLLILTLSVILIRSKKARDDREKLLIVSERAVAASEAKSSFLSSMSHEIRTPINAMLGMNEMILRKSEDNMILEYASNIRNSGRTLLFLINSILDFSKIEEGKMEIIPVEYGVAAVINSLVVSVMERAKDKGLEFSVSVDQNLPSRLFGDDVRLSQVIMNLLTNAVKYTETGSVRLVFREERREGKDIDLYVAVEDTGIGIRDEDRGRLFESFERLDEVKNHGIEGTGLGMSIVTNLLKMMGSKIELDSEYGKGSTFRFVIRQGIVDETPIGDYSASLAVTQDRERTEGIRAEKAEVLVVDDNDMNLKVAANLLSLFGITPKLASSGLEAIECVKKEHFQLILLDHMMPKLDGTETLSRMKEEKLLPEDTTVVALTANAIIGAKEQYLAAGFDDYLSKPIELQELETLLKHWLPEHVVRETSQEGPEKIIPEKKDSEKESSDEVFEFSPEEEENFKFSPEEGESIEAPDTVSGDPVDKIKTLGLDTEAGIRYCAGDKSFYLEMIEDYVVTHEEKVKELNEAFVSGEWHEFEVKIHALKSTSRTIGAIKLSEQALKLEEAAEKRDAAYIRGTYPVFLTDYKDLAHTLKGIICI